jgi:hypothetical protein
VRGAKRKKIRRIQQKSSVNNIEVGIAYESLPAETNECPTDEDTRRIPKPPSTCIHGAVSYTEMIKRIKVVAEDEQCHTRSLTNDVIKINCSTPDTYIRMAMYFKGNNIYHHTYHLEEERAPRIVIKCLHCSIETEDAKHGLDRLGRTVRTIISVRNRVTEEPLNSFHVDLGPAENNKTFIVSKNKNKLRGP